MAVQKGPVDYNSRNAPRAGLPGTPSAERVTRWRTQPEVGRLRPEKGVSWRVSWRQRAGAAEGAGGPPRWQWRLREVLQRWG